MTQFTDEQILEAAKQLGVGYTLKRVFRFESKRDTAIHTESVAEHVYGLMYLAHYFLEVEPAAASVDREKLYSLLLFHDFGEIKYGDVSYHLKTAAHEERERQAAKETFAELPAELQPIALRSWQEYEEHESREARFAAALDKIEPMFELLDPLNVPTMKRLKFTYEMHIGRKLIATEGFPVMRRFVEVVSQDMDQRGIFWKET